MINKKEFYTREMIIHEIKQQAEKISKRMYDTFLFCV